MSRREALPATALSPSIFGPCIIAPAGFCCRFLPDFRLNYKLLFRLSIALIFMASLVRSDSVHGLAAQENSRASAAVPATESSHLQFSGEVLRGQFFARDIGHDLVFRLVPAVDDDGGGWVIEIMPKTQVSGDPLEFSAVATPPYHRYNDRYIAAAFGYSAKEAVADSRRKFYFVLSLADQNRADDVMNATQYPTGVSDQEKVRVAAEAGSVNLASGQLHIVHSRIASGKSGNPDMIALLDFEVTLDFSPGLTLQNILAPAPPAAH
jgi:hypothetical protein